MDNIITYKCLIAADVDKTYVEQGNANEREAFLLNLAPQLNKAAILGTSLALITGNSMHELTTKFLKWYIKELCTTKTLNTLTKLHLFCNSGGIYAHFSEDSETIKKIACNLKYDENEIFDMLTEKDGKEIAIKPEFIQLDYLEKTKISEAHEKRIVEILEEIKNDYTEYIKAKYTRIKNEYFLEDEPIDDKNGSKCNFIVDPEKHTKNNVNIQCRKVQYLNGETLSCCTSQITVKPILSWRYAKNIKTKFNNDLRTKLVCKIQEKLDSNGLSQYIARPGGRSSIDITLEKLDKAYALEYLIDKLNIAGQKRFGEKYGCNTLYLGDEVISGGGNDYAVTRIPGVLVLAVNPELELIPFLSNVLVTSDVLSGPTAAANILANYNEIAQVMIEKYKKNIQPIRKNVIPNAIYMLKEKWFIERIREKVNSITFANNLSMEEKNMLHTLVTLICREDNSAKSILSSILREFDEVMATLENADLIKIKGCGSSHPDN
ncbi:MAG: hypothetical protein JXI43_06905 [Tissierellales bacterium]|nr:hypothetical protein [Tissierellales bacterium]